MSDSNRPMPVTIGLTLMYAALIISLVFGIISYIQIYNAADAMTQGVAGDASAPHNISIGMFLLATIIEYGIIWFFIFSVGRGRNWARVVILIFTIIFALFWIIHYAHIPGITAHLHTYVQGHENALGTGSSTNIAVSLICTILYVITQFFVFSSGASSWFKCDKN